MAKRRMFSVDVVGQDKFLDMPTDSRELYFQLGMYADDEGFVSPRKVMRITGASEDSLKILLAKGFAHAFKSGIIVVSHWNQNNYIQGDRFTPSSFAEEKAEWMAFGLVSKIERTGKKKEKPVWLVNRQERRAESELPYSFDYKIRRAFFEENCPVCNTVMNGHLNKPTIQHCVPISKGGKHELTNIAVICLSCNESILNKESGLLNNEAVIQTWEAIVSRPDTQAGREVREERKKEPAPFIKIEKPNIIKRMK